MLGDCATYTSSSRPARTRVGYGGPAKGQVGVNKVELCLMLRWVPLSSCNALGQFFPIKGLNLVA